jgi:hypothetical protein
VHFSAAKIREAVNCFCKFNDISFLLPLKQPTAVKFRKIFDDVLGCEYPPRFEMICKAEI